LKLDPKSAIGLYLGPEVNAKGHRVMTRAKNGKLVVKTCRDVITVERYMIHGVPALQSFEHKDELIDEMREAPTLPDPDAPRIESVPELQSRGLIMPSQRAPDTEPLQPTPDLSMMRMMNTDVDGALDMLVGGDMIARGNHGVVDGQPVMRTGTHGAAGPAARGGAMDCDESFKRTRGSNARHVHSRSEYAGNGSTAQQSAVSLDTSMNKVRGSSKSAAAGQSPPHSVLVHMRRYPLRDRTPKDSERSPVVKKRPAARYVKLVEPSAKEMCLPQDVLEARSARANAEVVDTFYAHAAIVSHADLATPDTYSEALLSAQAERWREAMESEYMSLLENDTWELVKREPWMKVIPSKWVFKIKKDADNNQV
jgi:hypothetical protein